VLGFIYTTRRVAAARRDVINNFRNGQTDLRESVPGHLVMS
jgi:hypothetical protein